MLLHLESAHQDHNIKGHFPKSRTQWYRMFSDNHYLGNISYTNFTRIHSDYHSIVKHRATYHVTIILTTKAYVNIMEYLISIRWNTQTCDKHLKTTYLCWNKHLHVVSIKRSISTTILEYKTTLLRVESQTDFYTKEVKLMTFLNPPNPYPKKFDRRNSVHK